MDDTLVDEASRVLTRPTHYEHVSIVFHVRQLTQENDKIVKCKQCNSDTYVVSPHDGDGWAAFGL